MIVMYKQAKSKRKQIAILAELALISRKEVRAILRRNGLFVPDPTNRSKITTEELDEIRGMLRKGMTRSDVAQCLGIPYARVRNACEKMNREYGG